MRKELATRARFSPTILALGFLATLGTGLRPAGADEAIQQNGLLKDYIQTAPVQNNADPAVSSSPSVSSVLRQMNTIRKCAPNQHLYHGMCVPNCAPGIACPW